MCFTRQVSLSSDRSSPKPGCVCSSDGTQSKTLPSSPADASISPTAVSSQRWEVLGEKSYPLDKTGPH